MLCPLCKNHPLKTTATSSPSGHMVKCEWCSDYWIEASLTRAREVRLLQHPQSGC